MSSLDLTSNYRDRLAALRAAADREAERSWAISTEDINGTYTAWRERSEAIVAETQRQAIGITSAYATALLTVGNGPVPPVVLDTSFAGKSRDGRPLSESLDSPRIRMLVRIRDGETPDRSVEIGRTEALRILGQEIDQAARLPLAEWIKADPRVSGWRRVISGTCGACMARSAEEDGDTMHVHPNCKCVQEPVVEPKTPDEYYPEDYRLHLSEDAELGVNMYVGSPASWDINRYLRGTYVPDDPDDVKAFVSNIVDMDRAFQEVGPIGKATGGAPVKVFRGLKKPPFEPKAGLTFTEKGYSSTSYKKFVGEGWCLVDGEYGKGAALMEITVDPRVKAIYGANEMEYEVLLERGCRYVITEAKKRVSRFDSESQLWELKVKILPPE